MRTPCACGPVATARKKASMCGCPVRPGRSRLREALEGRPHRLPPHCVTATPEPEACGVDRDTSVLPIAPADPDRANRLAGTASRWTRDSGDRNGMLHHGLLQGAAHHRERNLLTDGAIAREQPAFDPQFFLLGR